MKLSLSLNIKVTILTFAVLPVLVGLGMWQLERAEEKREIEARYLKRQQQAAMSVDVLNPGDDLAFTPVVMSGSYDNQHHFLLDNRMHKGQLGYEVLTPFLTEAGNWILINRGWIPGHPDRRSLPSIPAVQPTVLSRGSVYASPGLPFLLKEQVFAEPEWPLVVQAVELEKFSEVLGRNLFPYVVRLDAGSEGALAVDWQLMNQEPQKHVAYAVQWFTMATALVFWFVFANTNILALLRHKKGNKK